MTKKLALIASLAAALTLPSWSARAVPVATAEAVATINGIATTDTDPGPASAFASQVDPGSFSQFSATAASNAAGQLGVTAEFFGAAGVRANLTATATWTETITSSADSEVEFDFFIPGGAIGFQANNVPGLSGGFFVEVLFNGSPVFISTAEVQTLDNSPVDEADYLLNQEGTALPATFATGVAPGFDDGGSGFLFGALSRTLILTPIVGDNTIQYTMRAEVDGLIGETAALASIGDPLNLSQSGPGSSVTIIPGGAQVPEPTTTVLLLAGLVGTARRRRAGRAVH